MTRSATVPPVAASLLRGLDHAPDSADILTLARLPLAGALWWKPRSRSLLFSIVAVAGLTDMADGWVARRIPNHSEQPGVWLDPLCDKAFVLSALLVIWRQSGFPASIPLKIAARELIQIPLMAVYLLKRAPVERGNVSLKAAHVGKLATVTQFAAIAAMLYRHPLVKPLSSLSALVGSFASGYYICRTISCR